MQMTQADSVVISPVRWKLRTPALISMIAFTDFLVFGQAPGLNLFIFFVSLALAITLTARKPVRPPVIGFHLGLSVVAAAPLLETPTLSGCVLSMAAIGYISLASAGLLPRRPTSLPIVFLRLMPSIVTRLAGDARRYLASRSARTIFGAALKSLANWLLPLGMGLIFLLLFSAANPLIERGLHTIDLGFLLRFLNIGRLLLWLLAAIFIWAMLRPRLARKRRRRIAKDVAAQGRDRGLLGSAVLLRCLWLFNLLFALQTMLDLMYLWGGADLPAGMSNAEYAHRGAYPLVATALLAAAFVLVAMRRGGPGDGNRLIRGLVIAWIGQNVLLCLSSILRLDLYVEAYSLTGLRMAAGVWMGLVAAGLFFILLKIVLRRSNTWLVSVNLVTLASVLYVVAFFDHADFVARFNVSNSLEDVQRAAPLDVYYLETLGPAAIPALDFYLASAPEQGEERLIAVFARKRLADTFTRRNTDWRRWSYRSHRLDHYLSINRFD